MVLILVPQPSRTGSNFLLEVFDWNQIEQAKSLGSCNIELESLEPFTAVERTFQLSSAKHGEKGEIRLRLLFTPEILYLLANVSSLVNVKWYLGVPLNDSTDIRLEIAQYGQQILGDNLIGLQVGNEPDLYAR